jgi:hypothetical protein
MPLQSIGTNLWIAEQPLRFMGLSVGTRMSVIRLADDRLVIVSPIAPTAELIQQIDALGAVAYIIAPNRYHHLFAAAFKQQYPQAEFLAAMGLAEKCPQLKIDRVLTETAGNLGADFHYQQFPGIYVPSIKGADPLNEIVFYHRPSRTLIITDIAFNFDRSFDWVTQTVAKLIRSYNQLRPSILEQWMIQDRDVIEQSVRRVLEWDFEPVIMAHGRVVHRDGKAQFKAGYEWFLDRTINE